MDDLIVTRLIIAISVLILLFAFIFQKVKGKSNPITTKFITRTAIFASIATVLYVVPYLQFKLPFFPGFLEIHLDEVPIFIAGFAYGPLSATFILVIRTLIKLPLTSTLCVGELADLLYGIAFIVPACFIYRKFRNLKGVVIGFSVGFILQLLTSAFFTTFVLLDFYMAVMGLPYEAILGMCQAVNPMIDNLGWSFFLFVGLPFNAFKDLLVVVLTIILYKKTHTIIDKIATRG